MIIDLIQDRQYGQPYQAKQFYNRVMDYQELTPDASNAIGDAMDGGTNEDVQKQLCNYIDVYGYNMDICEYINGQRWID